MCFLSYTECRKKYIKIGKDLWRREDKLDLGGEQEWVI
jgi:hypothetical protein